jgi:hypothetical protein
MAINIEGLEQIRELDQVLMSRDPTVLDALKQALVLSKVAENKKTTVGPLENIFWELQTIKREFDLIKAKRYQEKTSDYWTAETYERGRNYGNWGQTTKELSSISVADIHSLVPNSGTVVYASPTDNDAFTMFDPDTGDSMSVKYK